MLSNTQIMDHVDVYEHCVESVHSLWICADQVVITDYLSVSPSPVSPCADVII